MSGYKRHTPIYLVDTTDTPVGVLDALGREWLFPAALTAGLDGGSIGNLAFGQLLLDTTNTPIGYQVFGREFIFAAPFTANTTRGLRQVKRPLLLSAAGVPQGLFGRVGIASQFPTLPVENGASSGGTQPLRAASPTNIVTNTAPTVLSGTVLNIRFRMPFYIGSADLSQLVLSSYGFYLGASNATVLPNAFSWVALTIEKDSNGALCDVTHGGIATKTVNPGDTDIQSDAILPANFSTPMTKFTFGDKYWIRGEYSVPAAGNSAPNGVLNFSFPTSISVKIDPATTTVGPVHGTGNMAQGNGVGFNNPYVPIILGRQVSGDARTIMLAGDSLVYGQGDTATVLVTGGAQRALFDSDGVSNPIGGIKIAVQGTTASYWAATNNALLTPYLSYGKYLYEEYGTNEYTSSPGNSAAVSMAKSKVIWDRFTAITGNTPAQILKPKITPRVTTTDAYATTANQSFLNAAWAAAGNARLFNDEIDTRLSLGQIGYMLPLTSLRMSTDKTQDDFYHYLNNGTANYATADGTHPTVAGYVLEAAEIRTTFVSLA